jgi:hypothetical protein
LKEAPLTTQKGMVADSGWPMRVRESSQQWDCLGAYISSTSSCMPLLTLYSLPKLPKSYYHPFCAHRQQHSHQHTLTRRAYSLCSVLFYNSILRNYTFFVLNVIQKPTLFTSLCSDQHHHHHAGSNLSKGYLRSHYGRLFPRAGPKRHG